MERISRRGREISRLEALSDAVFGFSATLLVVSLEVPGTVPELVSDLKGFVAFGLSFGALVLIWTVHNAFFRRYGLDDGWTVFLNSCLLFVVLFYVYPLKLVSRSLARIVLGIEDPGAPAMITSRGDLAAVFMLYGAGFMAIFLCVALLYRHAHRRREALGLDAEERFEARFLYRHYLIFVGVGALSVVVAWSGLGLRYGTPGHLYLLIGVFCTWHARVSERSRPAPAGAAEP